ncbi:MAG: phospholipase D-like domain-containing protein, partial [Pseudomonadota bacterium]
MLRFFSSFFVVFVLSFSAFAWDDLLTGSLVEPEFERVEADGTPDDMIARHVFNQTVSSRLGNLLGDARLLDKQHITSLSAELIDEFYRGRGHFSRDLRGVDASQKVIVAAYYQISDPKIVEALIAAKEKGMEVLILTDLNTVFDRKKSGANLLPIKSDSQLKRDLSSGKIRFRDSQTGNAIQTLLDAGFSFGNNFVGYPLVKNKPYDIFHLKQLLFLTA